MTVGLVHPSYSLFNILQKLWYGMAMAGCRYCEKTKYWCNCTTATILVFKCLLIFLKFQPYTLEVYKSLKDKLALLDCAIKMHDGNAITAVSIFYLKIIYYHAPDVKFQYINGSLLIVIHEVHLRRNLFFPAVVQLSFCSPFEVGVDNAIWVSHVPSYI